MNCQTLATRCIDANEYSASKTCVGRLEADAGALDGADWRRIDSSNLSNSSPTFISDRLGVAYGTLRSHPTAGLHDAVILTATQHFAQPGIGLVKLYASFPEGDRPLLPRGTFRFHKLRYFLFPSQQVSRERLRLGSSYDAFLARLGRHSRRNIRKAEAAATRQGLSYALYPPAEADWANLVQLTGKSHPVPVSRARLDAVCRTIGTHGPGFCSTLVSREGEIISAGLGYIDGTTAYLLVQLNHRDHLADNPCLTNRLHLIRHLIADGVRELIFVRGCRGVLYHACEPEIAAEIWILQSSLSGLGSGLQLLSRIPASSLPAKLYNFVRRNFAWSESSVSDAGDTD